MLISNGQITIGASAVALSTVLQISALRTAAKIRVQVAPTNTGNVFVGTSSVTSAGANAYKTLQKATAGEALEEFVEEDQHNRNSIDINQYYVHGSVSGDKVNVSISQN